MSITKLRFIRRWRRRWRWEKKSPSFSFALSWLSCSFRCQRSRRRHVRFHLARSGWWRGWRNIQRELIALHVSNFVTHFDVIQKNAFTAQIFTCIDGSVRPLDADVRAKDQIGWIRIENIFGKPGKEKDRLRWGMRLLGTYISWLKVSSPKSTE